MNKTETLENQVKQLEDHIKLLNKVNDDQAAQILDLQTKLQSKGDGSGRKSQVLDLLVANESISIQDMATSLNISTKNVSSQLTYLRSDGYKIFTDHNGRKILMNKPKPKEQDEEERVVTEVVTRLRKAKDNVDNIETDEAVE